MELDTIYDKLVIERNTYGWRLHTDSFKTLGYDTKFGSHLIRLLHEGAVLLETGKLEFPLTGQAHKDIMDIRKNKVSYEELLQLNEKYYRVCKEAYENTTLRDKPDYKWIEDFQVRTLLTHIKKE